MQQNQPTLVNGYWTWNGRKFHDLTQDEQMRFETGFADLLFEHNCSKYRIEYWERIGDEKYNEVINVLARSVEHAYYIAKQQSKYIFKIIINGKEYKANRNA